MTDRATLAEPAERGRTIISDAAVEHIAVHAAGEVMGVVQTGSALDQVIGRRYPKADAQVAGTRARVHIEIAVGPTRWPM